MKEWAAALVATALADGGRGGALHCITAVRIHPPHSQSMHTSCVGPNQVPSISLSLSLSLSLSRSLSHSLSLRAKVKEWAAALVATTLADGGAADALRALAGEVCPSPSAHIRQSFWS